MVPVRPLITYASEEWTVTQKNEERLGIFERRTLRKPLGLIRMGRTWRKI